MNFDRENVARLALGLVPSVGPKTVLRSFSLPDGLPADEVFRSSVGKPVTTEAIDEATEKAWRILNDSDQAGIEVIAFNDARYPEPLKSIPDPPPFLYLRGVPPDWKLAVAVIGTREPSRDALQAAQETVEALAWECQTVVVSGLALGIDSCAHETALRKGLCTVAVLANGLDTVYPKTNSKLAAEIVESGGALISEVPIGQRVTTFNLVARDRLQSGLSLATILIQSSVDGGSMHTARFTLEQKRTLIALRPLDVTEEWSGNRFLTQRASDIDWRVVSPKLQNFAKLRPSDDSFALRLSTEKIPEFVRSGLEKRFVTQQNGRDIDAMSGPTPMRLGF
jgi:DNA protecting protein DprA